MLRGPGWPGPQYSKRGHPSCKYLQTYIGGVSTSATINTQATTIEKIKPVDTRIVYTPY